MRFSYYDRLTPVQRRVYRQSDAITSLRLPGAAALGDTVAALAAALEREDRPAVQAAAQGIFSALTRGFGVPPCRVEVLSARPQISDFVMREVLNAWGHLEDADFAVVQKVTRPVASTVERGIEQGAFRPVAPLFVHLLVMASLNFFMISRAARARGARIVGNPMIDPEPAAFARFVAELVTRGLAAQPHGDRR